LGTVLTIISLIGLGMALASKIRSVQIFGVLGFLSMALAEITGVLFVLSGFQNDNYSHGMATNFILTFGFYFLELYFMKPAPKTQAS
jgi:ABC-type sugar transport system permease subunit